MPRQANQRVLPKVLPRRSEGVLLARLGDRAIVYDSTTEVLHYLNLSAGLILATCDGSTGTAQVLDTLVTASGASVKNAERTVSATLEFLGELGLVGRARSAVVPSATVHSSTRPHPLGEQFVGAGHLLLDVMLRFRSPTRDLVEKIDAFLGTGVPDRSDLSDPNNATHGRPTAPPSTIAAPPETIYLDVEERASGHVALFARDEWLFPDRSALFRQLVGVINEYARCASTCLSLHAGAVRSPTGRVVVLPGEPDSGKSTLVGAFILAGWDYLGDEAIGIRENSLVTVAFPKRLALDELSQRFLETCGSDQRATVPQDEAPDPDGVLDLDPASLRSDVACLTGDVAPVNLIVFARFDPGVDSSMVRLDSIKTLNGLAKNSQNLSHCGEIGLRTLCGLAERVPGHRLLHRDARTAVAQIAALLDTIA